MFQKLDPSWLISQKHTHRVVMNNMTEEGNIERLLV
jgi:hypothetical protein